LTLCTATLHCSTSMHCRYPGDAIASKAVPLTYFATALGGIVWAGYTIVMKAPDE
jgi:hypothetical protein